MYARQYRIPFSTDEAYAGLAAVEGIMLVEDDQVILEYQMKDNILGMLKSETRELVIPFEELAEVHYKRNWFVSRFRMQVNSMRILGEFPAGKGGQISLKVPRKQKENAKEIESYINLRLSEIRLDRLGGA
jgi:hypothetical protein